MEGHYSSPSVSSAWPGFSIPAFGYELISVREETIIHAKNKGEGFVNKIVAVIILVIALVVFSGCLSSPAVRENAEGVLHAHYDYTEGWSFNQGCNEHVTGYVYNAGNGSSESVQLYFNLVNTRTGTIRDSKAIFIGTIGQGATKTYDTYLDGECTQDYDVTFSFGK